jgi:hypothetical protein
LEEWGYVIAFLDFEYDTGGRVLNSLQFVEQCLRAASQKSIAIIKSRQNKCTDEDLGGINGKVLADGTYLRKGCVSRPTHMSHMFLNREIV